MNLYKIVLGYQPLKGLSYYVIASSYKGAIHYFLQEKNIPSQSASRGYQELTELDITNISIVCEQHTLFIVP